MISLKINRPSQQPGEDRFEPVRYVGRRPEGINSETNEPN